MLGLTAQNLHWTKEACRNLEEARQRDPGNPTILMNLGAALGDAGRPGEALTHLRLCARIKPRSPEVHRLLGKVLRQAGNVREGEAELRLAAALEAGGGGET